jgi:radical SAM protein with 4Fe4S-binding SPASM domain
VHAVWELTLRCDLACRHCGSRAGRARPDELSLEEALDLVRQLGDLGVREVTLIGGEAYLYDGWARVVSQIRAQGMSCTLVSGGRGITPEIAQAAADAGVQSVSISIDGDEPTHDRLRGVRGSYRSALAAFDALEQAGIARAMNSQINRLNMGQLGHLFEVASSHRCHGWQVIFTVPAGRAADEPEVLLQPYDLLSILPALGEISSRCSEAGIRLLPGNNVGYFGPLEHQLRGALRCPSQASCSAGRSVIGIEANGDIKGCPSLPTRGWVGGNVRDHSVQTIWERSAPLRYTRDLTVEGLWGYCRSCYYAEVCKGGCTWTSASLFERPGNNPYCHHRALEFASRGLRERLVRTEAAPGEPFDHGRWAIIIEPAAPSALPAHASGLHPDP